VVYNIVYSIALNIKLIKNKMGRGEILKCKINRCGSKQSRIICLSDSMMYVEFALEEEII
jgi:hypothetical protein